jgi:hypothetical protein
LSKNKNSTHCPNDTSFYMCTPLGDWRYNLISILYDLDCETYTCCPSYFRTTLSGTGSTEQNETPVACCQSTLNAHLQSMVKNETLLLAPPVEGSTIAPNTSAENSQQRLQVAIVGLVTCICFNLYY